MYEARGSCSSELSASPNHLYFYVSMRSFSYLYHDDLWKNSVLVAPLVESINTLGSYIFEIHKEACGVKEDDLSFSSFSFKKQPKSSDEVVEIFLKA